jgi:hypothetical protein
MGSVLNFEQFHTILVLFWFGRTYRVNTQMLSTSMELPEDPSLIRWDRKKEW